MASNHFFPIISSILLLLPLAFPSLAAYETTPIKTPETHIDVVVEGMVYCQSCDHYGSWSMVGAEPVPSAKVSIICKNHKNKVSFYKAYETDGTGYFYAHLDGFKMTHYLDHPLQSCHVKLVSSPLENCNLLSNVNYGLYGAPLRYGTRSFGRNYEAIVYSAGPLAFHPAHCPPTTHY
ncbi:pistil-specific extensin-like protein [Tripterygium wilfordii]|uniref:Pistil-specific extensin-like protein n=1 Tax=Tripterygium wilfordii TaxID=458696 RepID=A0A7J7E1V7_TRIWF|nr:non-classical arabinogalactan protein 30 [Tripterygium wilfordii]KAF5752588.1 pistil-specific extensin-like protein [Tripterygium wilfordii]